MNTNAIRLGERVAKPYLQIDSELSLNRSKEVEEEMRSPVGNPQVAGQQLGLRA